MRSGDASGDPMFGSFTRPGSSFLTCKDIQETPAWVRQETIVDAMKQKSLCRHITGQYGNHWKGRKDTSTFSNMEMGGQQFDEFVDRAVAGVAFNG